MRLCLALPLLSLVLGACQPHAHAPADFASISDGGIIIITPVDGGASDGAPSPSDLTPFMTAAHAPLPMLPTQGGAVIAAPHVVTITFSDFPFEAQVLAYMDWLMPSAWLPTVGADYGVGAGTHEHVQVASLGPTSITADGMPDLIEQLQNDGVVSSDEPANTVYLVLFSPSTPITDGAAECRADFAPGYHSESLDSSNLVFGVIGTCADVTLAYVERSLSHEIIEAATDPHPSSAPSYIFPSSSPWSGSGGEVADMCNQLYVYDQGSVARSWSNTQALAGGDPCAPVDTFPWFFTSAATNSIIVAAGATANVALTSWSTAPTTDWSLVAYTPVMDAAVVGTDPAFTNNGESATLSVTVPSTAKSGDIITVRLQSNHDNDDFVLWSMFVNVK